MSKYFLHTYTVSISCLLKAIVTTAIVRSWSVDTMFVYTTHHSYFLYRAFINIC